MVRCLPLSTTSAGSKDRISSGSAERSISSGLNYCSGVNARGYSDVRWNENGRDWLILADFLMGRPLRLIKAPLYGFYTRQFYDSLYVQDNWKDVTADIQLRPAVGAIFVAVQQPRRE